MANPRPTLNVASAYEAFLFAPVDDSHGGMRLSVLSALARSDVDPWEEAARLATLTPSDAEQSLRSILNRLPGRPQSSPEAESLAARLVALLPRARSASSAKATANTEPHEKHVNYWLVWLYIGIVMSLLMPRQPAMNSSGTVSTSTSRPVSPPEVRGSHPTSSGSNSHADVPPIATTPSVAMKSD